MDDFDDMDAFEKEISQLMKQDFSAGTEKFQEELLARCLAILEEQNNQTKLSNDEDGQELDDGQLDLLAAAGDISVTKIPPLFSHDY